MCWSASASVAMVGLGTVAATVSWRRGDPPAIWTTLGYFTLMELLQAGGYSVANQCGSPANRAITGLSYLHIVFQPLILNAFVMAIAPAPVSANLRKRIWVVAATCSALVAVQALPLDALGECRPGTFMCGRTLCLVTGEWHIGWEVPLNGLYQPISDLIGYEIQFPAYMFAVFVLPLFYGAWRWVLFQFFAGPGLAMALTSDPNEVPAVWCLFSIGLLLIGLSPAIRHGVLGAHRGRVI